ncbi:MAG: hypothetical protein SFZ24_08205, partial [Planctomycetota bacterium]|nr:hypothetical protein [Planctomycetota bacterium]
GAGMVFGQAAVTELIQFGPYELVNSLRWSDPLGGGGESLVVETFRQRDYGQGHYGEESTVYLLCGNAGGGESLCRSVTFPNVRVTPLAVADMNLDGLVDIVVEYERSVGVLLSKNEDEFHDSVVLRPAPRDDATGLRELLVPAAAPLAYFCDPRLPDLVFGPTSSSIRVAKNLFAPPCAGDANLDRLINFEDVVSVLRQWSRGYPRGTGPGDADRDGTTDFDDVVAVMMAWTSECPPAVLAAP